MGTPAILRDLRAAAITVVGISPIDVGYGLAAFSALGLAYAYHGIAAAFLALIIGNLVPALFRNADTFISGGRPAQTLVIAALVAAGVGQGAGYVELFGHIAACVMLAGGLQIIFGLCRFGAAIRYFPLPVTAGYTNGVAVMLAGSALLMIVATQAANGSASPWSNEMLPRLLFVVLLVLGMWLVARKQRVIHWAIFGLLGGTALFHLNSVAGGPDMGLTLPETIQLGPDWDAMVAMLAAPGKAFGGETLRTVLPYALTIAILNALDTLMAAAYVEVATDRRHDGNALLVDHGLANLMGGILGALPMAPSVTRSALALQAGASTARTPLLGAAIGLLLMVMGGDLLGAIPKVVAGALLLFLAWTMVDEWSRGQVKAWLVAAGDRETRARVGRNLAVMLVVVVVTIAAGLIAAMAVGLILAMALFVRDNSRPVIGRSNRGSHRRSLVMRSPAQNAILDARGNEIIIVELVGPLFFGTADQLLDKIDDCVHGARHIVFDCRLVTEIDATGARIMQRMTRRLDGRGVSVHLACVNSNDARGKELAATMAGGVLPADRWHPDADRALEACEDELLGAAAEEERHDWFLRGFDFATGMTVTDLDNLFAYMEVRDFAVGAPIFQQGDPSDRLYVVVIGRVEITLPPKSGQASRRLAALRPGVVFGEMGMLRGGIGRTANALAVRTTVVWSLSRTNLARLHNDHPALAAKLLGNIAYQLASRLAIITDELRHSTGIS